jgi:hypothetical protein
LLRALPTARAECDRLLDALARVRAGEARDELRRGLAAFDARVLRTAYGDRSPAAAIAHATTVARFDVLAGDTTVDGAAMASSLRERSAEAGGGKGAATLLRLAALRDPADHDFFLMLRKTAGRRGDHAVLAALGTHGDPRGLRVLRDALGARDVDPGRGFTPRRPAADGIGDLGLAAGVGLLVAAVADERADFEGRPGAGLGIQYPVRANLLRALGEIGGPAGVPTLLAALSDTSGSAFGGFYLPAMDALVRLGPVAVPALRRWMRTADEEGLANAVGVLAAIGEDVSPYLRHPSAVVQAVAGGAS